MESTIINFTKVAKSATTYKQFTSSILSSDVVVVSEKKTPTELAESHFDFLVLAKIADTNLTFRYQRWWNGRYEIVEYFSVYLGHHTKDEEGDLCFIEGSGINEMHGFYFDTKRKSTTQDKRNDRNFRPETTELINRFVLVS